MNRASLAIIGIIFLYSLSISCKKKSNQGGVSPDIPSDPGGTPPPVKKGNIKPVISAKKSSNDDGTIDISVIGINDPSTGKPIPIKANSSVYVTEDGVLKGLLVSKPEKTNEVPIDIAFLVDTSGSMDQESDEIAAKMADFDEVLKDAGVDARIGVVGFFSNITGAFDLSVAGELQRFLYRRTSQGEKVSEVTGVNRTIGFMEPRAKEFTEAAKEFEGFINAEEDEENGLNAALFAETMFSWRPGVNRVFVQFTDEPTFSNGLASANASHKPWRGQNAYTIKEVCPTWRPERGQVHLVWSGGVTKNQEPNVESSADFKIENPADLAKCTGGVVVPINETAEDFSLTSMPITKLIVNSVIVKFKPGSVSGSKELKVTIINKSENGELTADGEAILTNISY